MQIDWKSFFIKFVSCSVWVRGVTTFLLNALRLNCTGNPADMNFEHRSRNKLIQFLVSNIGTQYIQTRSTLEATSNDLLTNIERLGTRDLLSYEQLSYDTILASIQSNNAAPLPVNVRLKFVSNLIQTRSLYF